MRTKSTYQTHCLLLITLGLLVAVADQCAAQRLLIDDFSIDQQGIETGQLAAFDQLDDPRLLGGGRLIWGGGASVDGNCESSTYAVSVANGLMANSSTSECFGTGNVTWPNRLRDGSLELSRYGQIQLEVGAIEGQVLTRVTVRSNVSGSSSFDTLLSMPGLHTFDLPNDIDLSSVGSITVASLVDPGGMLALDAVWLAVPEPSSATIVGLFLAVCLTAKLLAFRFV